MREAFLHLLLLLFQGEGWGEVIEKVEARSQERECGPYKRFDIILFSVTIGPNEQWSGMMPVSSPTSFYYRGLMVMCMREMVPQDVGK